MHVLKETGAIQVHDTTSLRCQLEVDEVHVRCGLRTLIGSSTEIYVQQLISVLMTSCR